MFSGSEIQAPPPIRERVTAVQQDVWKSHGMESGPLTPSILPGCFQQDLSPMFSGNLGDDRGL